MTDQCPAAAALHDDRVLSCVMVAGHFGPVHTADDGEQWADADLPLALPT